MLEGGILFPVEKRFLVSFKLWHSRVTLRSLVEKGSVRVTLSKHRKGHVQAKMPFYSKDIRWGMHWLVSPWQN